MTLARIKPDLAIKIGNMGSVAQEAACIGKLTLRVDRRNRVARRQRDQLVAMGSEERIVGDNDRCDLQLRQRCERRFELILPASIHNVHGEPERYAASCTSLTWASEVG